MNENRALVVTSRFWTCFVLVHIFNELKTQKEKEVASTEGVTSTKHYTHIILFHIYIS